MAAKKQEIGAKKQVINYNGKRSNTISSLKRKNIKLIKQMKSEITKINPTEIEMDAALRFEKAVTRCANITLYAQNTDTGVLKHVSSHTCNHKACHICNYLRQKKIRRKYYRWFEANSEFLEIVNSGKKRIVTQTQYLKKWKAKDFTIAKKFKYDIMFLTLSVPHYADTGFQGEKFYFKKLRDAFNTMRKTEAWQSKVYGGEFGIEITKKENGLHIHIHSLVFVKQFTQNRNKLHLAILSEWNRLTVNSFSKRKTFDQETRQGIKKGNKQITDKFIDSLNPQGSTIINLNTIFTWTGAQKSRVKEFNSKEMLYAVMEAISYHFEPQAFDKKSGEFDLPLLIELLPALYNLRIYDRFGVLYNESALALNNNEFLEDFEEVRELLQSEESNLSVPFQSENFIVTNPAYVYHIAAEDYRIVLSNKAYQRRIDLDAINKSEAFAQVGEMVKDMVKKGKVISS